jgi:hypothetical protein
MLLYQIFVPKTTKANDLNPEIEPGEGGANDLSKNVA